MEAYSMDLRRRVLADCDDGMPTRRVALKHRVSPAWVRRLKQRRRQTGEVGPRPSGGRRHGKIDRAALLAAVRQRPDATLAELRRTLGLTCSLSALWYALDGLRLSFKKSR